MMIHYLLAMLAISGLCAATEKKNQDIAPASVDNLNIKMHGLVLIADQRSTNDINLDQVTGLYVDKGVPLPGSLQALQKKLKPLYLNQPITRDTLLLIKNALLQYYSAHNLQMITVEIPEQDITSGVVTFVVTQARLGEISYIGNNWYSKKRVASKLGTPKSDDVLDENKLLNAIGWLNQNPFHHTEAVLSPGDKKGTTNLEIVTKDRFPLRVYTGGDNTGVESTGTGRYYAGFTWGDAFFINDMLSYQFTSNSTYNKFHSHSLNYLSFLPWKHLLMLSGGYAEIHPKIPNFHHTGKEAQASVRYKVPFKPLYTNFQHQLYAGFDYKYVTSALFFVGTLAFPAPVMQRAVNVTQAMLGYTLEYTPSHHALSFQMELFGSPCKWLPHQTDHAYSSFRHDAKPRYFYGTLALGDVYTLASKDSISALLRGQGSANTLIPSEQFSLGGYNTVRGYPESVFISDNGICANLEVRARPLSLFKRTKNALTFLAFMDYGWGYNYHAFDGITKTAQLWGTGPGLRYTIGPYASLRVDYGFKLHSVRFGGDNLGMWHVGANASY